MKAKLLLLISLSLVSLFLFTAPAFAWTHGQFNATTDACAGCHVAHAAQAPKLLKTGPTQTEFCYLCHADNGVSAPYDIRDGRTTVAGVTYASTAGGFVRQLTGFDALGDPIYAPVTSRHNVWGMAGESGAAIDPDAKFFAIPGSGLTTGSPPVAFTGNGFVCSSCHDPHAGGRVPAPRASNLHFGPSSPYYYPNSYIDARTSGNNPRLLRRSITVVTSASPNTNLGLMFQMESVGTFTYGPAGATVASGVYRVFSHNSDTQNWCGACHNKFKTPTTAFQADTGHAEQYFGMWRHPMRAHIWYPDGADFSMDTGTPPEAWPNGQLYRVGCLTCHRAHSTTAAMNGWATSWPRDLGLSGPGTTSALLRMDSRGMCYNCHGAGEYNCWNDTRPVKLRYSDEYVPFSCSGNNSNGCHYGPATLHYSDGGPYDCSTTCHNG